jgi:hypothetical protein
MASAGSSSYRLTGSQARNPQHFIPANVVSHDKTNSIMKRYILTLIVMLTIINVKGQMKSEVNPKLILPDTMFLLRDTSQLNSLFTMFKDSSIYYRKKTYNEAWYSTYLYVMKEPILFTDTTIKEVYRFTWLRTFDNPIAIRIEKNNDSYILYWKLCDGAGGYNPGKLTIEKHKNLNKSEWEGFVKLISQSDFWNLQTDVNNFGFDGATWILEGKISTRYHEVDVWCPDKSGNFYQCCDYLLGLTDLRIKKSEKY